VNENLVRSIPSFALILSALSVVYNLSFVVHRPLLAGLHLLERDGLPACWTCLRVCACGCWRFFWEDVCPVEQE
jgi:hypothetical protein